MEEALLVYIPSLSTKVIVYKGQLMAEQLVPYFPDLADPTRSPGRLPVSKDD